MWYDEPGLLKAVEARLHQPIIELGPGYSLPQSLMMATQGGGGSTTTEYGSKSKGGGAGGGDRARLAEHVQSLRPAVRELAGLEFEAQNIWHGMMQGTF